MKILVELSVAATLALLSAAGAAAAAPGEVGVLPGVLPDDVPGSVPGSVPGIVSPGASSAIAWRAFQAGRSVVALQHYRAAAAQGHPIAQHNLGVMLMQGIGTSARPVEGVGWVRRAAEHSRGVGPVALARSYYRGGLLLRRHRAPEAEPVLRQAQMRLIGLGLTGAACVVEPASAECDC